MKRAFLILLTISMCIRMQAQEFRCAVSVNYQKLQTTTQSYETSDTKIFETMKESIETFMNSRRWTNLEMDYQERIEASVALVLNKRTSATEFEGEISIQMRRPVYNSNYTSGLFNYKENGNLQFTWNENTPLEFDPNTYFDNLSSTLAYYAYILLGMYFDSFGMEGGTPFYDMAGTIAQTASQNISKGWNATSGQKARYWFWENHTNSAYADIHAVYYKYNRLGLDMMTKDQKTARANIIDALRDLQNVNKVRSNLLSVTQFVDVKMQEITSIFTPAPDDEKKEVYQIIREISPINATKIKEWSGQR